MPTPEVDNATKTDSECDGCGACCAPGILGQRTEAYLEILPNDLKDDFKSKQKLVVKDQMLERGGRLFLPVIRGENAFTQCEHLSGQVLESAACGCYDTRPTACRIFEPGGAMCQQARQAWLVHKDKVMWEKKLHPEYSNDEAVYAVVARDNCLSTFSRDNHILESLGTGPDYIHLRKLRDEELHLKSAKVECSTLDLPKDCLVQKGRKRKARTSTDFRAQHVAHKGKGIDPTKKGPRPKGAKSRTR